MALGLGDGGEQNAPLGRAVIGGLLLATFATLFFVPASFSVIHGWLEGRRKTASAGRSGTLSEFEQLDEFDKLSE
jgi:antibiotic biosynthesis monooxygenase (ABM) superfamily enzyme